MEVWLKLQYIWRTRGLIFAHTWTLSLKFKGHAAVAASRPIFQTKAKFAYSLMLYEYRFGHALSLIYAPSTTYKVNYQSWSMKAFARKRESFHMQTSLTHWLSGNRRPTTLSRSYGISFSYCCYHRGTFSIILLIVVYEMNAFVFIYNATHKLEFNCADCSESQHFTLKMSAEDQEMSFVRSLNCLKYLSK